MLVPEMSEASALPVLVFAVITMALTGRQLGGLADTYCLRFSGSWLRHSGPDHWAGALPVSCLCA